MDDSFPAVEQAVIAVQLGEKENAVSVAQATPNASQIDVEELLNWAKRIELFNGRFDETNLFFFPTPSGALAIGRLTPDRDRPRNSGRYYFQTMLVAPSVFYRCGSNPATIYHLALNTTHFSLFTEKSRLKPFVLNEGRSWIDVSETQRTSERIGARAIATLTQSILDSIQTSFVSECRAFLVVSTLFSFFPISWRPELTFAVGVKFRGDAPIRLLGTSVRRDNDPPYSQMTPHFFDLRDVCENNDDYPIVNSWATLVETAIKARRVDFFYRKLAENFFTAQQDDEFEHVISPDEIAIWGVDWGRELEDEITKDDASADSDDALRNWKKFDKSNDDVESTNDKDSETWSVWKDGENDEDWGFDNDRWRIDSLEMDDDPTADRPNASFERRGGVDFIFDDEQKDDATNENANLFEKRKNEPRQNADSLSDDLIRLLKKLCKTEFDEAIEETSVKSDASPASSQPKKIDAANSPDGVKRVDENDKNDDKDKDAESESNDVPPRNGKRRIVVSLKGSDFAETVRGLKKMLEPQKTKQPNAASPNADRPRAFFFADLIQTPSSKLCDEFPEDEPTLQRLDALVADVCRGRDEATRLLADFWTAFQTERDEETLWRIRGEYSDYLNRLLKASLDADVVERIDLTTNTLDVLDILMR